MPKISVIIPVYAVEIYIARCAISLFEQTLDDIEYIFIDDCSPDHSIEILKNILERYPHRKEQTKIVKMPHNSGQAAVRQVGIQLATGEYLIHCDSDDWVDIQIYEKLYKKARENDYDIVFCDYYNSDGNNHIPVKQNFKESSKEKLLFTIAQNNYWHLWGALVKRSVFIKNNIIYPKSNNGEDFVFMIQIAYYTNHFCHLEEPLYYYYFNPISITNNPTYESYVKRTEHSFNNTTLLINFFKREKDEQKYKDVLIMLKLYCRAHIAPISYIKKYKDMWYSIFPELEQTNFIFNTNIPINLKINYYSVITNSYQILKKIQSFLKR